ncbi:MAG: group III truncated hemoglobin [Cyclobacteriaceae bacterium]|nr:group III truncated hemoglobin [Cyclobacteriaceae bacterium HetDA_MAG_MS6]
MKNDITSKVDIARLIDHFYDKVLRDPDLNLFFKEAIGNWPYHKQRFVDFWSSRVLFADSYQETPLRSHIAIDKKFDNSFHPKHFEKWTSLFNETVDELFEGEKAKLAKDTGANVSQNIYKQMFIGRKPDTVDFN